MQLSPHFSLTELTYSATAIDNNIDNSITNLTILTNLKNTALGMEQVRTLLGNNPIKINSAYRCLALNTKVGSKPSSQHLLGEAVDFTCSSYGGISAIINAIVASSIKYDQLIHEFNSWVHISFSSKNRKQVLIIDKNGARPYG